MNKDLVSIIVLNWNGKKWLAKCLDSLLSQTYENFEIILVDNASDDDSVDFLQQNYNSERLRVVQSTKNLGFAGGNNLGIEEAKGEYIMLFNNDAWVEGSFLEKVVDFYRQQSFSVVAPIETNYDNTEVNKSTMKIDFLGHPIYLPKVKESDGFYLHGVCLFFEKDLYRETLGLDEDFFMYLEEVDWFWRLNLLGKTFSFVPEVFIHHAGAGSTGGGIKYKSFLWRNQNSLQILLKNYSWSTLCWVLPLYLAQNLLEIFFFLLLLKPRIAWSYVEGWIYNMKIASKIIEKRRWVQEHRLFSDRELMQRFFYRGFAKGHHLISFMQKNVLR